MKDELQAVVVIPHLWVQNANAIASPMTYGFPAMTAFTGAVHAIERKLKEAGVAVGLKGVGVVCHSAEPQTNRESGYVTRFNLTRNPLAKDKEDENTGKRALEVNPDGSLKTPSLVEEGRMHLDVSLVIGIESGCPISRHEQRVLAHRIEEQLRAMRLAGGSVLPHPVKVLRKPARLTPVPGGGDEARTTAFRKLARSLLPGFALVGRHALLAEHLAAMRAQDSKANALDALLDLCALHWAPEPLEDDPDPDADLGGVTGAIAATADTATTKTPWHATRRKPGWLVPIPVGYAAISELYPPGVVKRARDPAVPFRFVESVLSLGEWKSPHRLSGLDELLWHYDANPDGGLYLVRTVADTAVTTAVTTAVETAAVPV